MEVRVSTVIPSDPLNVVVRVTALVMVSRSVMVAVTSGRIPPRT